MAMTLRPGMVRIWPFRINISNKLTVSSVSIKLWIFSFVVWSRTRKPGLSFIDGPSRANFAVSGESRKKANPKSTEECPSFIKVMFYLVLLGLAAILVLTAVVALLFWLL